MFLPISYESVNLKQAIYMVFSVKNRLLYFFLIINVIFILDLRVSIVGKYFALFPELNIAYNMKNIRIRTVFSKDGTNWTRPIFTNYLDRQRCLRSIIVCVERIFSALGDIGRLSHWTRSYLAKYWKYFPEYFQRFALEFGTRNPTIGIDSEMSVYFLTFSSPSAVVFVRYVLLSTLRN